MKVFISWSGDVSRELAETMRDWLPSVLQSVKPFFTPTDIEKGARWSKDIAQELEDSQVGIFCLTKENLSRPWIMFEAGALSKKLDSSRVCPVLFGVDNADLEGPLVQFQASPFSEVEVRKLIKTINSCLGENKLEDSVLTNVFEMWWPRLDTKVKAILETHSKSQGGAVTSRTDRDILEEILELTRLNASSGRILNRNKSNDLSPLRHSVDAVMSLCLTMSQMADDDASKFFQLIYNIIEPIEYMVHRSDTSSRELEIILNSIKDIKSFIGPMKTGSSKS